MRFQDIPIDRVIHGSKTAIACCLGFMITRSVHFPVDQWILITILVVMCAQINVGSMLQKSYMRFMGTLIGSIIAALTLFCFGDNPIASAVVVILAGYIFSYIATSNSNINDAGTLGAVTVAIILLGQHPTMQTAAQRFLEISLGILIAAIISQLVFPIHARTQIRRNQAKTLKKLRDYYFAVLMTPDTKSIKDTTYRLDESIASSLIDQRKLAKESVREPFGTAFDRTHFSQLLWCEKEISRSITFMNHAIQMSPSGRAVFIAIPTLKAFNDSVCETLEKAAQNLESKTTVQVKLPNLATIQDEFGDAVKQASDADGFYINAYLFCAGILVERLAEMIKLIEEIE